MKTKTLEALDSRELVDRFVEIAIERGSRLIDNDVEAVNLLYERMQEIVTELRSRPGDQRRLLVTLYSHPNIHVRLTAAENTLAAEAKVARRLLEEISASGWLPDSGHAGMCLWALDQRISKPT